MSGSVNFDRIARRYEETRGGLERGNRFAPAIDAFLAPGSRVLEIGVGTGAIARPLLDRGHRVVGIDISAEMLALARPRLPALARADATAAPFAEATFDAVVSVWAVHLIGDRPALWSELVRLIRPGGRFVMIGATATADPNDLSDLTTELHRRLSRGDDRAEVVAPDLGAAGFTLLGTDAPEAYTFEESPAERIRSIEGRDLSVLWDLDDDTWATTVEPILDRLRRLPDPDRPRACVHRNELAAYRRQ